MQEPEDRRQNSEDRRQEINAGARSQKTEFRK
jgi:hypothetical protein